MTETEAKQPVYAMRQRQFTLILTDAPETSGIPAFGLRTTTVKPTLAVVTDDGRSIVVSLTGRRVDSDRTGTHATASVKVGVRAGAYPDAPEWVYEMVADLLGWGA